MSVQSEIARIKRNIADAYAKADAKGAKIPEVRNSGNLPSVIASIASGGLPEGVYTIDVQPSEPEGGTVIGGGIASTGMTVKVRAEAGSGYTFTGWHEDGNQITEDSDYTFQVSGNRNLIAEFIAKKPSRLPEGYIEVEYIQSDNNCGIDIGINPNVSNHFVIDIEPASYSGSYEQILVAPRGKLNSYSAIYVSVELQRRSENTLWFTSGNTAISSNSQTIERDISNKRFTIDLNFQTKTLSISDDTYSFAEAENNRNNMYLFSGNNTTSSIAAKLFSCQMMTYDGRVARDLVPCISPEGFVGLYDLIGSKFYGNSFDGTLSAGPAI